MILRFIGEFLVPGAVILGIVIFFHELGHFLVAKWRGVRVLRFSMGFGPALLKFQRGETEYRLSWIPLGGYVQMAGDSPGEDGSMPQSPDEFLSHPWQGRLLIALAGPAANLVTAYLVWVVIWLVGVSHPDFPNVLGPTPDTSFARQRGLREGDRIIAVAGTPVSSWDVFDIKATRHPAHEPLTLTVQRRDSVFDLTLRPEERRPLLVGLQPPPTPPVVDNVVTGMPAYKAGLKEGDRILAVNGRPIHTWEELPAALRGQVDKPVRLKIRRGSREFEISVSPINPEGRGSGTRAQIGIEAPRAGIYKERYGPFTSMRLAFWATGVQIRDVYRGMWLTVAHPLYYREYLGGPMFIAQAASEQARRGLDRFLQFLAMINLAIMAFNLLPIPVLDGGHIMLALLQALRGQAISANAYLRLQKVGLLVIGALFILILANDPLRVVQRRRALDRAPQEDQVAPNPP